MKWFLIEKNTDAFPLDGTYKDWKERLRDEGRKQCVYCAIHEVSFGGYRNFHVEHFRPKSKFKALTDDYGNLFYVCSICNAFKGSDWPEVDPPPNQHDLATLAYPPPHLCDLSDLINVGDDGVVSSPFESGRYLVERVYLNRPQLIRARRMWKIREELEESFHDVAETMKGISLDAELATRVGSVIGEAMKLLSVMAKAAPYEPHEVVRP